MTSIELDSKTKHSGIYRAIFHMIRDGRYGNGHRLPTERQFTQQFKVSRSTVIRALRDLEREGVIERRQGSGSFVRATATSTAIGLMVPGLTPESIFVGVQQQFVRFAGQAGWRVVHADGVLQGEIDAAGHHPVEVARALVAHGVKGVVVVPHQVEQSEELNRRTLEVFAEARVSVVLLDRDIVDYPRRSQLDLVSVDHERGGQMLGQHLLEVGAKRVIFVGEPLRFPSARARLAGLRHAMLEAGQSLGDDCVRFSPPGDAGFIDVLLKLKPDTIVCDNDQDAAIVMRGLLRAGVRIPEDIRLAGFDDQPVAKLLAVPLTTVAQPMVGLAAHTVAVLRTRMDNPNLAPTTCLVQGELIVRASTTL